MRMVEYKFIKKAFWLKFVFIISSPSTFFHRIANLYSSSDVLLISRKINYLLIMTCIVKCNLLLLKIDMYIIQLPFVFD